MDTPPRKRGRPRVVVTDAVLEQRRLAKQRSNAARGRADGPSNTAPQASHVSGAETPRKRNRINMKKRLFGEALGPC
ncbi:hypothetical protein ACET3Z_025848 [Daucus carota]